jgi:hypothetical protein
MSETLMNTRLLVEGLPFLVPQERALRLVGHLLAQDPRILEPGAMGLNLHPTGSPLR